jgi:SpoVK/Ycf46/Vps4 family AAA+-type ATPase
MADEGTQYIYNSSYEGEGLVFEKLYELLSRMRTPVLEGFVMETETHFSTIDFEAPVEVLADLSNFSYESYSGLWRVGDASTYVAFRNEGSGSIDVKILAPTREEVRVVRNKIIASLPRAEQTQDTFRCRFWHMGPQGPTRIVRSLDAPSWSDIKNNYTAVAKDQLEEFIRLRPEQITGGRLAILHGPPGTGKTTMIRSLCKEWKDWCDVDYITDPEQFFGQAFYMNTCLLAEGSSSPSVDSGEMDWNLDDDDERALAALFAQVKRDEPEGGRWRILVIEDAEEFLNPQAKEHTGQALSRLLNVGDGFIGQGLNILILLTTNTKMDDVHEAVKRPGRCMVNIEVPKMSSAESIAWLGTSIEGDNTLAELFEAKKHTQIGEGVKQLSGPTGQYI